MLFYTLIFILIISRIQEEILKNDSHDVDLDAISKFTAQDLEDAANEELAQFKFGSIETGNFF